MIDLNRPIMSEVLVIDQSYQDLDCGTETALSTKDETPLATMLVRRVQIICTAMVQMVPEVSSKAYGYLCLDGSPVHVGLV